MRDSQGGQLFMQAIVAPMPVDIIRVDAEKDVRRMLTRMYMQQRGILPALFLAVIHAVDRHTLIIKLVIINGRGDGRDHWKQVGMLEGQAQGPLPSHADSL